MPIRETDRRPIGTRMTTATRDNLGAEVGQAGVTHRPNDDPLTARAARCDTGGRGALPVESHAASPLVVANSALTRSIASRSRASRSSAIAFAICSSSPFNFEAFARPETAPKPCASNP